MKITINNNNNSDSRESAIVEINTKHCHYPYSIRESLELALKLDGYSQETISKVFNQENEDAKKIVSEEFQAKLDHYFPELATSRTITKTNECVVSKKKQSSIEWLENQLKERYSLMNSEPLFEQAKAMRKEEIEDAYRRGFISDDIKLADDYYNETFNNENTDTTT